MDPSVVAPHLSGFEQLATAIGGVAVAILVAVLNAFFSQKKAETIATVQRFIEIAYGVTNNAAKVTKTQVDDKAAYALGILKTQLAMQGLEMTPAIQAQAKATWDAMHAQEKLAGGSLPLAQGLSEQQVRELIRVELAAAALKPTLPSSP